MSKHVSRPRLTTSALVELLDLCSFTAGKIEGVPGQPSGAIDKIRTAIRNELLERIYECSLRRARR